MVVKNEDEHRKMAVGGWKDNWLDEKPYSFAKENKKIEEEVLLEKAKEELELEKKEEIKSRARKLKDGDSKRQNKKSIKTPKS
jgi:hypothetical protein